MGEGGTKLGHVAKTLAGVVLVTVVFVGYVRWVEGKAQAAAESFCASATVGSDASALPERAIAAGAERRYARWARGDGGKAQMLAVFTGVPPFSRHLCTVETESGRVVATHLGHLD